MHLAAGLLPGLLHIHLHVPGLHHHFHGPPFDYAGLAVGALLSFLGLPGPGEPLLIAAGILAARHKLDIAEVILIAWAGATVGGVIGWGAGLLGGRRMLSRPGPFLPFRLRVLQRGDEIFRRHGVLAVLLAPSWSAGIHRMDARRYLVLNAFWAIVWAAGIGMAAFWVGPAVVDWVQDVGLVTGILLVVLLVSALVGGRMHIRRRARARAIDPAARPPGAA